MEAKHDKAELEISEKLSALRIERGMSQSELSAKSGIDIRTLQRMEAGERLNLTNIRRAARALQVETLWLVPKSPVATPGSPTHLHSASMSQFRTELLTPGWSTDAAQPDIASLAELAEAAEKSYLSEDSNGLDALGPRLLRACAESERSAETADIHAKIYSVIGRHLIQMRAYDLALIALSKGLAVAAAHERIEHLAYIRASILWARLRLGELENVETQAATLADELEPKNVRGVSKAAWLGWGLVLARAAAAAARNNRVKEAHEYVGAMRVAATAYGPDTFGLEAFGPTAADLQEAEVSLISGRPDEVLRISPRIQAARLLKDRRRHQLDLALALAETGDIDSAGRTLSEVHADQPRWCRQQHQARRVVDAILQRRTRALPEPLVPLAAALS